MKNKKRGFTLIELLAVIVILAIIAIVAVPVVLNMINNAKKKAAESSALGFVEAIEYANGLSDVNENYTKIQDGTYGDMSSFIGLKMKGNKPVFGEVTITSGKVKYASICIGGYNVTYENNKAEVGGKCVTKKDDTAPDVEEVDTEKHTNRVIITFRAVDPESGIRNVSCKIEDNQGVVEGNTCTISDLKNNTTYEYEIDATNRQGITREFKHEITTKEFDPITITPTTDINNWVKNRILQVEGGAIGETLECQIKDDGESLVEEDFDACHSTETITKNNQTLYVRLSDDSNNVSQASTYNESKVDPIDPDLRIGTVTSTTDSIIIPIESNEDNESGIKEQICRAGNKNGTITSDKCVISGLKNNMLYSYEISTTDLADNKTEYTGSIETKDFGSISLSYSPSINTYTDERTITVITEPSPLPEGQHIEYREDEGEFEEYDGPITVSENGKSITARLVDEAGNVKEAESFTEDHIDSVAPTTSYSVYTSDGGPTWYKALTVKATISDTYTNVESAKYCITTSSTCEPNIDASLTSEDNNKYYTIALTGNNSGQKICTKATDTAGNESESECSQAYQVDTTQPQIVSVTNGTSGDWYINISISDNGDLAGYAVTSSTSTPGSWTSTSGTSQTINNISSTQGTRYVWVKDAAGNTRYQRIYLSEWTYDFDYSGSVQTFTAPYAGRYKLEVFGASGGGTVNVGSSYITYSYGGKGGYSYGTATLTKNQNLYVVVGGQGKIDTACSTGSYGGYNGGGTTYCYSGGGGGATHIGLKSGLLTSFSSDYSTNLLLVAGGGGGAAAYGTSSYPSQGGAGGGTSGVAGTTNSYWGYQSYTSSPGTQSSVGSNSSGYNGSNGGFGRGKDYHTSYSYMGGGGGGFYGGANGPYYGGSGAGGSGYVNTNKLSNAATVAGNNSYTSSIGTETGHIGNGYARIIYRGLTDTAEQPCNDGISSVNGYKNFAYTGGLQTFNACAGRRYKLEVWGAEGGYRSSSTYSGKGGYSYGTISFSSRKTLYVYVGGSGNSGTCSGSICAGGYNGGGYRYSYYGGGGGTDIRIGADSLYARVIVAGGGGSDGKSSYKGGDAGGETGIRGTFGCGSYGYGGTQNASTYTSLAYTSSQGTTNGSSYAAAGFGFGGFGSYYASGYGGAGGGGWYGGQGTYPDGSVDDDGGGGGGSGYVYTSSTASNYPSGCLLNSSHYLTSAETKAGNTSFTAPGGGTETGHTGNGYARITLVGLTEIGENTGVVNITDLYNSTTLGTRTEYCTIGQSYTVSVATYSGYTAPATQTITCQATNNVTYTYTYACFTGETKVYTPSGYKEIKDIKEGDIVYSYNEKTKKLEESKVNETFIHSAEEHNFTVYEINVGNEKIKTTSNHPFYVKKTNSNKYEWLSAENIEEGDYLYTSNKEEVKVNKIRLYSYYENFYNLNVAGNHNYYVSESNYLVHNYVNGS